MNMRLTPPVAAHGPWLIAGRSAAGAILLAIAVSACTGGGSSVPTIFTPTPSAGGHSSSQSGTRTPSPTGQGSRSSDGASAAATSTGSVGASASGSPHTSSSSRASASSSTSSRASDSATPRPTQTATPAPATHTSAPAPTYPTAAPETGGGGTAGLQDGLLFGVGGVAVFAGLGALAYRRRLSRKFSTDESATRDRAPRDPANR